VAACEWTPLQKPAHQYKHVLPARQTSSASVLLQQSSPGKTITSAASTVALTVTIRRDSGLAAA
jgi:hypothetical protein